jgi:hypothetical protein
MGTKTVQIRDTGYGILLHGTCTGYGYWYKMRICIWIRMWSPNIPYALSPQGPAENYKLETSPSIFSNFCFLDYPLWRTSQTLYSIVLTLQHLNDGELVSFDEDLQPKSLSSGFSPLRRPYICCASRLGRWFLSIKNILKGHVTGWVLGRQPTYYMSRDILDLLFRHVL